MNTLYHYTSVDGFDGIIKNNSIRMTRSHFLNDPTDCNLFIALVKKYVDSNPPVLEDIIKDDKCAKSVRNIYCKNGCDLVHYIKYIHEHISLYVMSLTKIDDGMNMWNNYGQGGMELNFSIDEFIDSLRGTLSSENEFLAEAHVIYTNSASSIKEIKIPTFSEFVLRNKDSDNIFEEHHSSITDKSGEEAARLYATNKLDVFITTYMKSYILTLNYLLECNKIDESTPQEKIFDRVFKNVSSLYGPLFWKHDLSLYMLVLSALIKSDTYEYEDEHRIVYFEYNIDSKKAKEEEYCIKHILSGNFVCPYVTFKSEKNDLLQNALKKITISPATKNLPINNEIYLKTLEKYISSKGFNTGVKVQYSQHTIRW